MSEATRWPEIRARHGAVAAPHALASDAGLAILRAGGNALDAAIAAAVTLAVVYPHMNGVGGDNLWLVYDAWRGRLQQPGIGLPNRIDRPVSTPEKSGELLGFDPALPKLG